MACGCSRNRATASGASATGGTYRVMVGGRQVYESTNQEAAKAVAGRFQNANIIAPGENP